jgi:hypothetical protein
LSASGEGFAGKRTPASFVEMGKLVITRHIVLTSNVLSRCKKLNKPSNKVTDRAYD